MRILHGSKGIPNKKVFLITNPSGESIACPSLELVYDYSRRAPAHQRIIGFGSPNNRLMLDKSHSTSSIYL